MADQTSDSFGSSLKQTAGSIAGKFKSFSDFLSSAVEATKELDFPRALAAVVPWAKIVGGAAKEAAPPIKFVAEILSRATEVTDPQELGLLACTTAYQRSVELAVADIGGPDAAPVELSRRLPYKEQPEDIDFRRFSYASALAHPFIKQSDRILQYYGSQAGYSDPLIRRVQSAAHTRFLGNLKAILFDGEVRKKFEPFSALIQSESKEVDVYSALAEHADFQRWLFEEEPLFRREPFALTHVYVETDCGEMTWGDFDKKRRSRGSKHIDVLNESGPRQPLLKTVMDRIADPDFADAMVIQGTAGAGKSAFTQRLCLALIADGLRPIRIRLRDLDLDLHISEALPRAIRFSNPAHSSDRIAYPAPPDATLRGEIFKEHIWYRSREICPYVLIFDGWDEVTISKREGSQQRIERLLGQIRQEYLVNRESAPVRVILTGRPFDAVFDSSFFRSGTSLVTMRQLSAGQLKQLEAKITEATATKPVKVLKPGEGWTADPTRLEQLTKRYAENPTSLDVLGSPLLAYLGMRLVSESPVDVQLLISSRTTLFRGLVDFTTDKAGKSYQDSEGTEGQPRVTGEELRGLLRKTASAMAVLDRENISREELSLRLIELSADQPEMDLDEAAAAADDQVTALLVSYYFKGGRKDSGCEFLHKSFREYLFAEQIVETLKAYGRLTPETRGSRDERELYWKDFADRDRWQFSEDLARMLAPQWLSYEVWTHVENLIEWEIARQPDSDAASSGSPNPLLEREGWLRTRDGLADVWDWWAEGVHLRPQPSKNKRGELEFQPARAHEWAQWATPLADKSIEPVRSITLDARLGEALLRMTCAVHFRIAEADGWLASSKSPKDRWREDASAKVRRCQTAVSDGSRSWVLFAPAKTNPEFFANYAARFNADGWRRDAFPLRANLPGVDLRKVQLVLVEPPEPTFSLLSALIWVKMARLRYANLEGATIMATLASSSRRFGVLPYLTAPTRKGTLAELLGGKLSTTPALTTQQAAWFPALSPAKRLIDLTEAWLGEEATLKTQPPQESAAETKPDAPGSPPQTG